MKQIIQPSNMIYLIWNSDSLTIGVRPYPCVNLMVQVSPSFAGLVLLPPKSTNSWNSKYLLESVIMPTLEVELNPIVHANLAHGRLF